MTPFALAMPDNISGQSRIQDRGDSEASLAAEREALASERTRYIFQQLSKGLRVDPFHASNFNRLSELADTRQAIQSKAGLDEDTRRQLPSSDELEEEVGNVIRYSAPRSPPERPMISIVAVQEWEGAVDSVNGDSFEATLVDVSANAFRPTEKMDIPLGLIDDEDRAILAPGVIFRLVIGRERRNGTIQNKTLIYIRRNKFRATQAPTGPDTFGELIGEWV